MNLPRARKAVLTGFDEAGRGPLAGPVAAAAVILPEDFPLKILNDSKKLSEKRREEAARLIREKAAWGVGWAEAAEIDALNILQASLLAMKRAFYALTAAFPRAADAENLSGVADGLYCPRLEFSGRTIPCKALVKADALIPEVMAASILAKTARDRMMLRYSWFYPEYGYEKHKGYPTREHRKTLLRLGPSPIQRKSFSFRPVQAELGL